MVRFLLRLVFRGQARNVEPQEGLRGICTY